MSTDKSAAIDEVQRSLKGKRRACQSPRCSPRRVPCTMRDTHVAPPACLHASVALTGQRRCSSKHLPVRAGLAGGDLLPASRDARGAHRDREWGVRSPSTRHRIGIAMATRGECRKHFWAPLPAHRDDDSLRGWRRSDDRRKGTRRRYTHTHTRTHAHTVDDLPKMAPDRRRPEYATPSTATMFSRRQAAGVRIHGRLS